MPAKNSETHSNLELTEGFLCDCKTLMDALCDERLISGYTQAPAKFERKVGGTYSLFDGAISGTVLELQEPTLLKQKWHRKEWNEEENSIVTIKLTEVSRGVTRLELKQTNIPERDRYENRDQPMRVREGWNNFIFARIHQVLGYGKTEV